MSPIGGARVGLLSSAGGGADIPDSGVLRYRFDEGGGSTATDSWGTNDGSIVGATYTSDSQLGSHALSFDGADDYVSTGYNPSFSEFSLCAWIKTSDSDGPDPILCKDSGTFTTGSVQFLVNNGPLYFDANDLNRINLPLTGSTTVNDNVYHHVVVTYDGSTVTLYVDGSADGNASSSGTIQQGGEFRVARRDGGEASRKQLDGIIDDPRIYDKGLSPTEVSDLYNTGSI